MTTKIVARSQTSASIHWRLFLLRSFDINDVPQCSIVRRGIDPRAVIPHISGSSAIEVVGAHAAIILQKTSHLIKRETVGRGIVDATDRKSTRLNSSHQIISYAVFC